MRRIVEKRDWEKQEEMRWNKVKCGETNNSIVGVIL
jgi:hypothetical protein